MKKLLHSLFIVTMLAVLVITPVLAGYTISPSILAGQNTHVGVVKITGNADGTMTLDFMLKGGQGYCITKWDMHAGLTLNDFPTNNGGAIPGQFDYHSDFEGCVTKDTFTFDPPGDKGDVYLAIHVVVYGGLEDFDEETGWVVRCGNLQGAQFPGNNWSAWILFPTAAWD
jgi:hypothetical protein